MMLLRLGLASAWNRRYTLMLTLLSVALAVTLLLGVERLRHATKAAFAQSISGTDLVIGARSSPVQLVLYAVFRLGEATNNLRWSSYESTSQLPMVAWSIPLSLGDSHRGFPVLGTTAAYFTHYRHGAAKSLFLIEGRPFATHFEAVLGAEVAARLGYRLGDRIILSHGAGDFSLGEHADKPFVVVGILSPTGTPVDRTVHVSLASIEAIHLDWVAGAPIPGLTIPPEQVSKFDLQPKTITAVLVGLKNRAAVFRVQRQINEFTAEPLLAVLPGVALDELWQVVGLVEKILLLVSALVVVIGLAGLVAVVLASLNERRRELAILRSVGASLPQILALLLIEGILLTICGALLGFALLSSLGVVFAPMLESRLGLSLALALPNSQEMKLLGMVVLTGAMSSLIPALQAYRLALADGLNPR
jgi:putative ABC transport system permease protein